MAWLQKSMGQWDHRGSIHLCQITVRPCSSKRTEVGHSQAAAWVHSVGITGSQMINTCQRGADRAANVFIEVFLRPNSRANVVVRIVDKLWVNNERDRNNPDHRCAD
jgi:hypothetical protein